MRTGINGIHPAEPGSRAAAAQLINHTAAAAAAVSSTGDTRWVIHTGTHKSCVVCMCVDITFLLYNMQ